MDKKFNDLCHYIDENFNDVYNKSDELKATLSNDTLKVLKKF